MTARVRLIIWMCSRFPTHVLERIIAGLRGVLREHERQKATKNK